MDYMDPDFLCPQKADKLNLSLNYIVFVSWLMVNWFR